MAALVGGPTIAGNITERGTHSSMKDGISVKVTVIRGRISPSLGAHRAFFAEAATHLKKICEYFYFLAITRYNPCRGFVIELARKY